jgi:hypothetical protein
MGVERYASLTGQRAGDVLDLTPFTCRWLAERVNADGRDASIMFYNCFAARYTERRPEWAAHVAG